MTCISHKKNTILCRSHYSVDPEQFAHLLGHSFHVTFHAQLFIILLKIIKKMAKPNNAIIYLLFYRRDKFSIKIASIIQRTQKQP